MTAKRRDPRVGLWIPVRAQGHDAAGKAWDETTKSLDASPRGVAFVLRHPVKAGDLLQITLPLPRQLRSHDHAATTYRTYALVASTVKVAAGSRVGAAFLGKDAPTGYGAKPAEPTAKEPAAKERRRGKRGALLLKVHLRFDQPQGGARQETTVLEDFSAHGAQVQSRHNPKTGLTLEIDESEGVFHARAEVRGSFVGKDGIRRLHLRFLPPRTKP